MTGSVPFQSSWLDMCNRTEHTHRALKYLTFVVFEKYGDGKRRYLGLVCGSERLVHLKRQPGHVNYGTGTRHSQSMARHHKRRIPLFNQRDPPPEHCPTDWYYSR